jgi:hypothetical protein
MGCHGATCGNGDSTTFSGTVMRALARAPAFLGAAQAVPPTVRPSILSVG